MRLFPKYVKKEKLVYLLRNWQELYKNLEDTKILV